MKDYDVYIAAPPKLIGMTKKEALKYLRDNDCTPFSLACEDGVFNAVPMDVRILLHIEKGIVVGTKLDGQSWGSK